MLLLPVEFDVKVMRLFYYKQHKSNKLTFPPSAYIAKVCLPAKFDLKK